jgi:hypothetical protein
VSYFCSDRRRCPIQRLPLTGDGWAAPDHAQWGVSKDTAMWRWAGSGFAALLVETRRQGRNDESEMRLLTAQYFHDGTLFLVSAPDSRTRFDFAKWQECRSQGVLAYKDLACFGCPTLWCLI